MDTTLDAIGPALVARLEGEPVEHAQMFFPGQRWLHPGSIWRWGRRALGKGRLDDRFPSLVMGVLAVTPTRIAIFESSTRTGAFELRDVFAIWRRDGVLATAQRVEMSSVSTGMGPTYWRENEIKAIRLKLQTPDGPFWADMQAGQRDVTTTARALGAKVSPAKR